METQFFDSLPGMRIIAARPEIVRQQTFKELCATLRDHINAGQGPEEALHELLI